MTIRFSTSAPLLIGLIATVLTGLLGCDSGPQPPETKDCTPVALTSGPVGEWEYLGLGGEDITSITSVAVHPCNPEVIYAGSNFNFSDGLQGMLFKTENGGQSWDTLRVGGYYSEIIIQRSDPDVVYVAHSGAAGRTGAGVLKSTDGGETWQTMNEGLELQSSPTTGVNPLAMRPDRPEVLYASTAGQLGGWFYRSTSGGEQWAPVERTETSKLLASGVTSITFDPEDPSTMYVGTWISGHLLKSTDGGRSWQLTGWNPPEQPRDERYGSVRDLYVVPETNTIYAAASPGFTPHGAYRSRDDGATWEPFTEGLPDSVTAVQLTGVPQRKELYIVATKGDEGGIYEYRLEAESNGWTKIGIDNLRQSYYASDLFYSSAENALYVGLDGIFRLKLEE